MLALGTISVLPEQVALLLIVNNALQGILSSFFYKFADTILKKYSSTMATIFTAFVSAAAFGHKLTANFLIGVSIVFISMHQFMAHGTSITSILQSPCLSAFTSWHSRYKFQSRPHRQSGGAGGEAEFIVQPFVAIHMRSMQPVLSPNSLRASVPSKLVWLLNSSALLGPFPLSLPVLCIARILSTFKDVVSCTLHSQTTATATQAMCSCHAIFNKIIITLMSIIQEMSEQSVHFCCIWLQTELGQSPATATATSSSTCSERRYLALHLAIRMDGLLPHYIVHASDCLRAHA